MKTKSKIKTSAFRLATNGINQIFLNNKLLTLAVVATVPSLFLWFSATLSYLYISYIGPFIFKLSKIGEIFTFLILPLLALFFGFLAHRKNPRKLTKVLIATNAILLSFVLVASLFLS